MTAQLVMGQLKNQPRLYPAGIIGRHPQGNGKLVHRPEIRIQPRIGEAIGIGLQDIHGLLSPLPVQPHRQLRRQMVHAEKFDQPPHSRLLPEGPANLPGFRRRDAGDLRQPLRIPLHHRQGLLAETLHNSGGQLWPNAPHRSGRQIAEDFRRGLRHEPLQKFRLKLTAIVGIVGPAAGNHQPLPRHCQGNCPHHSDNLSGAVQPQHGIPVFMILKYHRRHSSLQQLQFLQGFVPPHICVY